MDKTIKKRIASKAIPLELWYFWMICFVYLWVRARVPYLSFIFKIDYSFHVAASIFGNCTNIPLFIGFNSVWCLRFFCVWISFSIWCLLSCDGIVCAESLSAKQDVLMHATLFHCTDSVLSFAIFLLCCIFVYIFFRFIFGWNAQNWRYKWSIPINGDMYVELVPAYRLAWIMYDAQFEEYV